MGIPRGIRNNNPGNIDYNSNNKWHGQLPYDPSVESRFAVFDTPQNGIRAMAKLLLVYQDKHGLNTVDGIISRWAPSNENATGAYIRAVKSQISQATGQSEKINLHNPQVLAIMVAAIIHHENGDMPYSSDVIYAGVNMAMT
ncbi:structural protein [Pseudomonas sp. LS1212]|uniref:structural protein n=1 Tax=Pseudomonas sp. LS1212 TaxID=2972478 RepID=UPI00215BF29C|nr:structural protein [Pseudomonas sp. LS1212]UVJ44848.1 structural protein [Pseudomonas sp. LS1212]